MKKLICIILSAIMILSSVSVFADQTINIFVNGQKVETDVSPLIVNDRTMMPFRAISEAIGAEVSWNSALQKVIASFGDETVILTIGQNKMFTNNDIIILDVAPFIQDGRTMIPVRAICEIFGCTVNWHPTSKSVIIRMPGYEGPAIPAYITQPSDTTVQNPDSNNYQEVIVNNDAYYEKPDRTLIDAVVNIINNYRSSNALGTLAYNDDLEAVAYAHSKDMAENGYLSHSSLDGTTFYQRLDNAGISYTSAAENIASGFTSAESVVESWMNSASHLGNIINPNFTKIAVGYYEGGSNGTYWTLLLAAE